MSKETSEWLNTMTLIGMTDKRGNAWHYRKESQGAETNHYPGAIPVDDVLRRLFTFEPVSAPVATLIPLRIKGDATPGATVVKVDGKFYQLALSGDRQAMVPSDRVGAFAADFTDDDVFGLFKKGYVGHGFGEWLMENPAKMLGDDLVISSAGLLAKRAVAFVELSVPENMSVLGFEFRPNLLSSTSLNGSLATQYGRTITNTVCDNTMTAARSEKGQKIKFKHTKYSKLHLGKALEALALVEEAGADFKREAEALASIKVSNLAWERFLTVHFAPEVETPSSLSRAENKREEVRNLWRSDDRVAPWAGTGFGVLQAVNTWHSHSRAVQGGDDENVARIMRNQMDALKGGFDVLDGQIIDNLHAVLV